MMWYWGGGTPWWGWALSCIAMLVFWGAVIWGIWYLMTHAAPRSEQAPRDPAERILDERFARGEIDADEYASRRDAIRAVEPYDRNHPTTASAGDRR